MIKEHKKRKKIFYVPGMISLIFIPLFCFYHFYKTDAFKVYGDLAISVSTKEEFENYKIESLRKYKTFNLEQEKYEELNELRKLRFFVRDLVKKYDTINGAKIHFGSKTDYDTFVSVINIMFEEKVRIWVPYKNEIYVLSSAKPKPTNSKSVEYFTCGYSEANKDFWLRQEEEKKHAYLISLYKKYWMLFLGYLGLVLINIYALVKFNKNK